MSDILIPLKKKYKTHKIASFDVETFNEDNDFYLVGLFYNDQYHYFYDIHEFYNHVKLFLKDYWIIATNLSFDITALFFNTPYWEELTFISNGGFMLMSKCEALSVTYLDTLNWHKASVKQLGDIIGIQKGDPPSFLGIRKPMNPLEEAELREYNKRDCEISYYFSLWFQDQVNSLGGELKITMASTSLDIWKRKYNSIILVKEDFTMKKRGYTTNLKNKIFEAYYGGRTEVIRRGKFKNYKYYDFNSLYPSVMLNHLPLPNSVRYINEGSMNDIKSREGVSLVTIEHITQNLPLLPYRGKGRLLFPSGKFKGWYTHIELREAIKEDYIITKIHETISYTKTFYPFKEFVTDFYEARKKAKKEKSSKELIYKLAMNSLYGKFGERTHKTEKYFNVLEITDKERDQLNGKSVTISSEGIGYYIEEEECTSSHVYPIFAVYITAYARIKLWKTAKDIDPVYMDTDSIVTDTLLENSNELGELKLEHNIEEGIFVKPKMYSFKDNDKTYIKMKGVPRATKNQFFSVLNNESVEYTKLVKLKEGLRRNLKINSPLKVQKLLDLEDIKREWDTEFSLQEQLSNPVIINDI